MLAKKDGEVKITFRAFNKDFNKAITEMNSEARKLRQEMKLQQEQLKHSGTETQKLEARMSSLQKIYDVARKKTELTAKQLEEAKKLWGENSNEAKKLEAQLKRNQIAEQQVANSITETQKALEQSKSAMSGLASEQERLESRMSKLNAEYELQVAQLGENATEVDKLKLKMEHLNKAHEVAGEKVANYEKQLEEAKKQYGENSTEVDKYEKELLEARKAEQELANQIDATNKKLKEQENTLRQTGERLNQTGEKFKTIGKNLTMKVTAPIAAIGAGSIKTGMEFEKSMSKVQALSGATADEMKQLEKQARELGKSTVFSASQAAEAQAFLAMAGYDVNQVLDSMPGLLSLAAAGQMDLGRAADITTNIMSAFGIEAEHTIHVADVLAKASANANTNVEQMGEAIKYLGPVAASLGWDLEQSAAAVMSLSNAGIQGSMAGQAFASSLARLAKPTKQMQDVMDELNISFFDANGTMRSMPDVIAELEKATAGMTAEQKSAALSTLFGAEAYKHWAVLLEEGSDALEENTQMLIEADGAAKDMADTMTDNLAGKWNEFISALQETALSIYESLKPALESILRILKLLVDVFNLIPGPIKTMIVALGVLVAAIGPVLAALGFMLTNISNLFMLLGSSTGVFGKFGGALGGLGKAFGGLTAMLPKLGSFLGLLTNPITLIVGAIVGIGTALVWAYNEFEWFRDAVHKLIDWIADGIIKLREIILNIFSNLWDGIKFIFTDGLDWLVNFLKKWGSTILTVLAGPLGIIIKLVIDNWETIKQKTTEIFGAIRDFIPKVFQFLYDKTIGRVVELKNSLTQNFERIRRAIIEPFQNVYDRVTRIFENMKNKISDIWDGLVNVVKRPINHLIEIINRFVDGVNKIKVPDWVPFVGGKGVKVRKMPMLAKGTNYFKGGDYGNLAIVGEYGPELVELPVGSRVHATQDTQQMLNNIEREVVIPVSVEIDGQEVARATAKYSDRVFYDRYVTEIRGR